MTTLLVGCGYWGKNWAKTLHNLGELGAICEPAPHLQAALLEQYPSIPLYDDLDKALQHQGVDTVVVATPVFTHLNVGRQCLQAGKSTLIEKPLTMDPEEAETLVNLAQEKGVTLAVGHLLMYQPALLKLQELIRQGELGDVLSVQCTRVNLGKVRNEENCWWSLAPHDLSILTMLLDEPFELINASKLNVLNRPGLEDTVFANFETPSGKNGVVHVSWYSPYKKHETVVIGSKKIAIFEDTQPVDKKLVLLDYDLQRDGDAVTSIAKGDGTYVSLEMGDDLLTLEAKAFLNAARQGAPLQNDGENGRFIVQLLNNVQSMLDKQQLVGV